MSGNESRILMVPDESLYQAESNDIHIVKLRHPKTFKGCQFLVNKSKNLLFELMNFEEEHRSWFIGSKVNSDGRIILSSPVNPVFLALPYISQASKLIPLDQMLEDPEFPKTDEILVSALGEKLEIVADRKGDKDLNVWKYNEEKTIQWLTSKVESISRLLEIKGIDLSGGASSNIYKRTSSNQPTKVDFLKYSFGIIQEYLSPELGSKLEESLNLPKEEKLNDESKGTKRLSSIDDGNSKSKRIKTDGPVEDYSKKISKVPIKEELSSKEKALAASAKGSKNIMSFFKKK